MQPIVKKTKNKCNDQWVSVCIKILKCQFTNFVSMEIENDLFGTTMSLQIII